MMIGARSKGARRVARIGALGLILLVAVVVPSRATGSSPLAFSFFTDPGISVPVPDHFGSGRRNLVHQFRQRDHRKNDYRRNRDGLRGPGFFSAGDLKLGRMGLSGLPTTATEPSGA